MAVGRSLPQITAPVSTMHSDDGLLQRKSNCACGGVIFLRRFLLNSWLWISTISGRFMEEKSFRNDPVRLMEISGRVDLTRPVVEPSGALLFVAADVLGGSSFSCGSRRISSSLRFV